ncbi:transcriptional repressor [Leeia sp. TBRC 13508]|uniref:Ferric uptake regulation protein n=1 Tax=Leeia speluncae TaxID=2884804 RepID=A0ABS8D3P4_9NEIS|nr:Fur family transcriptional regulator [Leeia speluncae]MCB6182795.1 transcriptional repressor [Leeia speluncae]
MAHTLSDQLEAANRWCLDRGEKLTDIRREVLSLLFSHGHSMKAYDILSELQRQRPNAAPPTVYRALDFLLSVGLIHRLDSVNAFVACPEFSQPHHHGLLLVCEHCHNVIEIADAPWLSALAETAKTHGFVPGHQELEIKGLCTACHAAKGNMQ